MNKCTRCLQRDINSIEHGTIRIDCTGVCVNRVYTVAAICSYCNQTVSETVRCFARDHMRETDLRDAVDRVVRNWNLVNGGAE